MWLCATSAKARTRPRSASRTSARIRSKSAKALLLAWTGPLRPWGSRAEDGAEATYRLGKDAAVDTEHGTEYTAKEGDHVVVHYSEEAGHKVVHFLKQI
jgi:hypothetical protein